jgi:hypothetical protein
MSLLFCLLVRKAVPSGRAVVRVVDPGEQPVLGPTDHPYG